MSRLFFADVWEGVDANVLNGSAAARGAHLLGAEGLVEV
jgi:hypothetical protein